VVVGNAATTADAKSVPVTRSDDGKPGLLSAAVLGLLLIGAWWFFLGRGGGGECVLPLTDAEDVAACEGQSEFVSSEDISFGGSDRMVFRYAIGSRDPDEIVAALAEIIRSRADEADEVTVFAYGSADPSELEGAYTRGRVVAEDGAATFDVCTDVTTITAGDGGSFDHCAEQETFTVALPD